MKAVRFAISANFWNNECTTFSRETTKLEMNDNVVSAALHSPTKSKFHDEYRILGTLRKGSCATVHECQHIGTGDVFAVKKVRRAKLQPSEDEFVLNEVSIMQSLSQYEKYVVQILDFYEEEDFFYLVRDFMSGGNVFDRILKKSKYTEENTKELTKSLLTAVQCMHEAGIAHRDLKPQNLLLRVSR
jgi:calcium/calmodulin-dependent protein kinase I